MGVEGTVKWRLPCRLCGTTAGQCARGIDAGMFECDMSPMQRRLFQSGCLVVGFAGAAFVDWLSFGDVWLACIKSAIVTTGVQKCLGTL